MPTTAISDRERTRVETVMDHLGDSHPDRARRVVMRDGNDIDDVIDGREHAAIGGREWIVIRRDDVCSSLAPRNEWTHRGVVVDHLDVNEAAICRERVMDLHGRSSD